MNRKFLGEFEITPKGVRGEASQVAISARNDMKQDKEMIPLLSEKEVFTPEQLEELYAKDKEEPWWNY